MRFFTKDKTTDPALTLAAARNKFSKADDLWGNAKTQHRECLECQHTIAERRRSAEAAAADAAARGEQPDFGAIERIEAELKAVQMRERALNAAVIRTERARNAALEDCEAAVHVERADRYAKVGRRYIVALEAALAINAELIAIHNESPRTLPFLFLSPLSSLVAAVRAELERFVAPPAPKATLPAGQVLVRFIKGYQGGQVLGSVGSYGEGEIAGFKSAVADDLVARGYAERVAA